MAANPFQKDDFHSYREWEEALVFFLADQLRRPNADSWSAAVRDAEARRNAAHLSLFLANFALAHQLESEDPLRGVFPALMGHDPALDEVRVWNAAKWVNQERLRHTLKYVLDHNVLPETHHLVA